MSSNTADTAPQTHKAGSRQRLMTQLLWFGVGLTYQWVLRPAMANWGTELDESVRMLPGDPFIAQPNIQANRALTIPTTPDSLWVWLAQMGRERNGFYNLDTLSNNGIPSARYQRHDLPAPEVGMSLDNGLKILYLDSPCVLVIGGFNLPNQLGSTTDLTLTYFLESRMPHEGQPSTRLLIRLRGYTYGLQTPLYNALWEPVNFMQTVIQLYSLRELAQMTSRQPNDVPHSSL